MTWWVWVLLGLGLFACEMLTPGGFYFAFFGIGAVGTGLLVWLGIGGPPWLEWLLFTAVSLACLARDGHDVVGVDIDAAKLEMIAAGRTPVVEEGMVELVASAARRSKAARRARRASSSCTSGTPNTAMTASPMNFSTAPPCRSIQAVAVSK